MPLIRIVRMQFREDALSTFEAVFAESQGRIAAFPGCKGVSLLSDPENSCVRYTYSIWESAEALNSYRKSELFETTWAKTKPLFSDRPQAFSLIQGPEIQLPKV